MRFATPLSALVSLLCAAAVHAAGPVPLDVFVPRITNPTAGTVWVSNTTQTVTWDASNAPVNISNGALIMLRHNNRTAPFILAKGFDLRSGSCPITVPWVLSDDDYEIVLFGDSGNFSPPFTITSDTANAGQTTA
ncbi:hypothetical protein MSAN_01586200 [Mycena sanguinolenta]|uniref:Yeast cell wall synthesis Kre9/Knh1-like N-terminal domain-containing protein n=1 Tax=Mycena sanguinolenta TaxID=230812 RepID=A0A8H7CY06_9AGAR|nr:hypothetical protein MSAN_01586200 [Mycena sanguinolenta]